jgi:protein-L-isoaspartate(D-aspartate) O-methyltransferase
VRCVPATTVVLGAYLGAGATRACDGAGAAGGTTADGSAEARATMVATQIVARGVVDAAVLAAMRKVPRHEFVPARQADRAYEDGPLPIGWGQTISQPYIVALMSELAALRPGARVLEVGTGSGYQAAVLCELGAEVYTIEIVAPLAAQAAATLRRLGYNGVYTRVGDGYRGWPEAAPFDAIVLTAAPPEVPAPLEQQLKVGGRLVVPVGTVEQELQVIVRSANGFEPRDVIPVRFVPMTGEAQTTPAPAHEK